ncbi:hypothetical protein J1605_008440 [Eschrichtius robustus]|uniref:Band 3 cytoplasmic domain-containing protein n=1 Tax=Eschrichtius robustus TaxID=9764 RepID=A0AB34GXX5_ESCRO|nr:hypothetical protein J1605_008440 [Eschrichtius robustus]
MSMSLISIDTPSQRVQFILGTEDDDEEHIPHDLFTELDEICWREGEGAEWRETASNIYLYRWLKFEEDVEDGGERWSKPYVATLSLHSLFELRSCILNGTVLLDMHANTLEEIADMVLDQQVSSGQLNDDVRHRVHEALMKQHHHQNQKKLTNRIPIVRSFADIGKKQSEPNSMDKNGKYFFIVLLSLISSLYLPHLLPFGYSKCVEAGQVVSPQSAPACVENKNDVSRENSTVDFSKVFHDVAYKAKDRNDLVSGIDEFLDQVTVLPPGEWDPSIRIEPPKNVPSQEKRKIPAVPNGTAAPGEAEPHGGHSGPELQRTGSYNRSLYSLDNGIIYISTQSAIESLFGASMTGIAYSLFGGQPLTILGSTGPVLVFEKILFKFCK